MAVQALDGTSSVPEEPPLDTKQLLDTAFDEFDVADLLETHSDLVLSLTERIGQLEDALESQTMIGQALGICIERYRITDEQAFQFLVRLSQDHNVKLRQVAAHLVERTCRDPTDGPSGRAGPPSQDGD